MLWEHAYEVGPFVVAMLPLAALSAFFSCSEAALFSLPRRDRRAFAAGNPAQRLAAGLLHDPDRLLTAVLFWNLVINVCFFALSSIVSIHLEQTEGHAQAGTFAVASLLVLIVFCEMLPKTVAVLWPRLLATAIGIPLAMMVRLVGPLMPALRAMNLVSRRIIWPRFEPEADLDLGDVQRAIQLSSADAALRQQEQAVLRTIVALSDVHVEELMRPRTQFLAFRPPVGLEDLGGKMPPSGYLLVTEPDNEAIASAVSLLSLSDLPRQHLEHYAEPVVYVPWSASAATALEAMRRQDTEVAVVINEFGETIGVLTFHDLLTLLFADGAGGRPTRAAAIKPAGPRTWHVTGHTSLRYLARHLHVELPPLRATTVAGLLQEVLQRFPVGGDECRFGPLGWKVLTITERGQMQVEVTRIEAEESTS